MLLPSGLHAHAVTLVLPPRSLLRTTMTDLLFRRLSNSQIRRLLSTEAVRNNELSFGCQATAVTAATWPLRWRRTNKRTQVNRDSAKEAAAGERRTLYSAGRECTYLPCCTPT